MPENILNPDEKIGVLIKTSLVDYPGHMACAVFLYGCNLRCPYCYNTGLVLGDSKESDGAVSLSVIKEHLIKRRNVLSGIVISGGEPALSPFFYELLRVAKELDYLVKIDTNGTIPDRIETILNDKFLSPDFVALDIKTTLSSYPVLAPYITDESIKKRMIASVKKSIELISALPADKREFRTVLVPGLVDKNNVKEIAELLPKDASWQFAPFRNENCLDERYNSIIPYTPSEMEEIVAEAQKIIPGAQLR